MDKEESVCREMEMFKTDMMSHNNILRFIAADNKGES